MRKIVPTPICDVCDRLTIAQLKYERLTEEEMPKELLQKQIDHYSDGIDEKDTILLTLIRALRDANAAIWDAESDLRAGFEAKLGDTEIAKRAIAIRDLNRKRVAVKNAICYHVGQPEFTDCKSNHLSA